MRTVVVAVVVGLMVTLAACGGDAAATGPPEIEYGRDVCDECHMIVTEPRFAAAYRLGGDDAKIFDDPGDMLRHGVREGALGEADVWVHDFETEAWLDAETASYVHGGDVTSPMGYRIVAFADESSATAHAQEHGGEVTDWDALLSSARAGDVEPLDDASAGEDDHTHEHATEQGSTE